MAQKILAGRCADPTLSGELVQVKVDQVVLSRAPLRAFGEALHLGLKRAGVEVAIAYDGLCVSEARALSRSAEDPSAVPARMLTHGILIARPGVGFPSAVHLERFASPARLCVTDDPRLAGVGGVGMLSVVVAPGQLAQALAHGSIWIRPPRSIQVLLSGRVRPFVCARDIGLELIRRGLAEVVRRIESEHSAPVVLEFAGPSVRLLSVSERAVLAALAPQLGAAASLFVSDERTEVFLRDQRRSKAHRALSPDAGAPCDDVWNVDLGAVDPLLLDEAGQVRSVRDLSGTPVAQVLLGGDTGTTLRDLLAAATLLKSKRVPPRLDFLVAAPSRQMLEVLASTGALTDLIATGARLVEPDARVLTGALYVPPAGGLSVRTYDREPRAGAPASIVVASAETLAYAVAMGELGDPRSFKRPVRVTVPRALPTDDVLVLRERRAADVSKKDRSNAAPVIAAAVSWNEPQALDLVDAASAVSGALRAVRPVAVVCATLDDVRAVATGAAQGGLMVRAVLAPFVPSATVTLLSGLGIAALQHAEADTTALLEHRSITLPAPEHWPDGRSTMVTVGESTMALRWLAVGPERAWASAGTARPSVVAARASAR